MLLQEFKQDLVEIDRVLLMRVVPRLWNHDIPDIWIAGGPGAGLLLNDAKTNNVVLAMGDEQRLGDSVVRFGM